MKMYLLSDNVDTLRGMRLAGAQDVAVVLVTQKLTAAFSATLEAFGQKHKTPLFVTVPDRHGAWSDRLTAYIKDAIGISV